MNAQSDFIIEVEDEELENPFAERAKQMKDSSSENDSDIIIPSARAGEEIAEFAPNYDETRGYAPTPKDELPHWSLFNHDIKSSEPDIDKVLEMLKDSEFKG